MVCLKKNIFIIIQNLKDDNNLKDYEFKKEDTVAHAPASLGLVFRNDGMLVILLSHSLTLYQFCAQYLDSIFYIMF